MQAKSKVTKAQEIAAEVSARFGSRDVFEIAEKACVKIVYESWYPTTIGEFEQKTKTILVNRRALENNKNAEDLERIIIAHELGHFFAAGLNLDKTEEERFCHEFAKHLLANSI